MKKNTLICRKADGIGDQHVKLNKTQTQKDKYRMFYLICGIQEKKRNESRRGRGLGEKGRNLRENHKTV
jgi:hypothetical protein